MKKYTLEYLKTPGNIIEFPDIEVIYGTRGNIKHGGYVRSFSILCTPYISFGFLEDEGETYLIVDLQHYTGGNEFVVNIKELQRIGMIEEFVLPENWWVRVTEENKEVLNKWRGIECLQIGQLTGMCKQASGNITKEHNPVASTKSLGKYGFDFGEEITYEQFKQYVLMEKEFIVPEKWCVKATRETFDSLQRYTKKVLGRTPADGGQNSYYHFPEFGSLCTCDNIKPGYTEISFADFQKYIIKQSDILPEKWCVAGTENSEERNLYLEYLKKIGVSLKWYMSSPGYYYFVQDGILRREGKQPKEYTLISFEEFKRLILKTDSMTIQHYEVIKTPPLSNLAVGDILHEEFFEECAKHTDFFKAVYKEEFKVGDWVIGKEGAFTQGSWAEAFQIDKLKKSDRNETYVYNKRGNNNYLSCFRKATPEEIEKATVIKIGSYTLEVRKGSEGAKYAKFGCQELTLADLKSIQKLHSTEINATITIHSTEITPELLNKIIARVEND